jgi:hypothetical protein
LLAEIGNHSQPARLLRIDRTSLYQRIERACHAIPAQMSEHTPINSEAEMLCVESDCGIHIVNHVADAHDC